MSEIGHNRPPSQIETVVEVTDSLNCWLRDHPVIQDEASARDAKLLIDRAKLGGKDLDDERTKQVKPLNDQVAEINERYRQPRDLLKKVTDELLRRVVDFIAREEAIRIKAAEEARQKAETAERLAREAEAREQEVKDDAAQGAVVDVLEASQDADSAFSEYRLLDRQRALAERQSKVRIGGGFGRALSLRAKETLTVTDACAAITTLGVTPDITAAIIKAARSYRTITGELPPGIESTTERTA